MEDAIAFLILGVGFSGLNATGYAVNHLDIAPRYAGILMGLSNTFATIPGFLSPMLTGIITKHKVRLSFCNNAPANNYHLLIIYCELFL